MFFFSAFKIFEGSFQTYQEQQAFERLNEVMHSLDSQIPKEDKTFYLALKEKNPDFFGWISIEGTILSYPVMHTPENEEFYLHRDFHGKKSQSGVPFLSAAYFEGYNNYLIYGHNMHNGSMFAELLSYADPQYYQKHPTIQLDTLTESKEFEVLAAFYFQIDTQDTTDSLHYYQYTDLSDPSAFKEYIDQVRNAALYETEISTVYGDELLTLSTCSYHADHGRFVVVARKANQ